MHEQPSVVPSEHAAAPEPELVAAILQRVACLPDDALLAFIPRQLRAS